MMRKRFSNALDRISEAPYLMEMDSDAIGDINGSKNFIHNPWVNKGEFVQFPSGQNQQNSICHNWDRNYIKSWAYWNNNDSALQSFKRKSVFEAKWIEETPEQEEYNYELGEENISDEINFENVSSTSNIRNYSFSTHPWYIKLVNNNSL